MKVSNINFQISREFEFGFGRKTGWTSLNDGAVEALPFFLNSFQKGINPTEFSLIFNNFPISSEGAQAVANMVPALENVRFFRLNMSKLDGVFGLI